MNIISFRPTQKQAEAFEKAVAELQLSRSYLAREAFIEGWNRALNKIAEEKEKEARKLLQSVRTARNTTLTRYRPQVRLLHRAPTLLTA